MKEWFTDENRWITDYEYKDKYENKSNYIEKLPEGKDSIVACCLLGAAHLCYEKYEDYSSVCDKMYNAINSYRPGTRLTIEEYNDSEYTTFNDIKQLVSELDI